MGIIKLLGTSFSTILNGGNPTADRTVTFPDKSFTVAGTNDVIGVGQTWQDVKGSRALATTYTNQAGKPIMLMITLLSSSINAVFTFTINGTTYTVRKENNNGYEISFSIIIPDGNTYSAAITATATIINWLELR